jgi:phospholipase C
VINLSGCGSTHAVTDPPKIQHVVIIFQENRTPDNLFHGLPGADIVESGVNSEGETIPLTPIPLANNYDLGHTHFGFLLMLNGGRMDGADKVGIACTGRRNCAPSNPQFKYVNPAEVRPYFDLAETYTFADRMFQTNQGPSFPAHQFILSGTSAPTQISTLFAAENPSGPNAFSDAGCTAPPQEKVLLIDPTGRESESQYPCFEHLTLIDFLDAFSVSWRYYAPSAGIIWTAPNAIRHLRFGPDWGGVVLQPTRIFVDIAAHSLANVSWVIPSGQDSDHPLLNRGTGPSWVAAIVDAIGDSPYWSNTAVFITWDDWGGWYDHVAPPVINAYEYGFRVPLIVVSPYAKAHYVSHVMHHFGSILRFIEKNFSLPSLNYADSRADDLSDCFDLTQAPLVFHDIVAPVGADYFLRRSAPPTDPDDD